jgi:predicted Fe-Mo cluster-binding NifX family protein
MLVRIQDGQIATRESVDAEIQHCLGRINWLCQRGVEMVICGGISGFSLRMLADRGIRVMPGVAGDVDEVLRLFLDKQLESSQLIQGAGRRRRCRQRSGGRDSVRKTDRFSK